MLRNEHRNIKIARLIFFFLGLLTIAVGFYATVPRLTQFASNYLSSDKVLSEPNTALLHGFRTKIILLGVILVLSSIVVKYFVPLQDYIIRKIESEHLSERTVSFIGRLLSSVYRIGTNEKFLWCLLILILISFSLGGVFFSSAGGFHVEGIDLQPAKNLVRHGIYATLTTRGFDEYTHWISAGPGIVLPNALIFKVFGINVYYNRALYAAFIVATVIILYYLARHLYGKKVALLTLFLFVPWMPFEINGADAYIPALFYFLAGALFWFKSIDTRKNVYLIISGLFWGLSFQTNWLFLFAIVAVIITYIILRLSNNGLGSKYYFIPALIVFLVTIIWFVFRISNVGVRQESRHLLQFWKKHGERAIGVETFGGEVNSIFEIARPIASLAQIDFWRELQPFLIIPAILYVIILIGKSKWTDYRSLFLISFILVWFTWWLLFNFDIAVLHIQIVLIMSQLFIAKLLYDMWEYSSAYKDGLLNLIKNKETQRAGSVSYLLRVVIIFIVLGKTLIPLLGQAETLYHRNLTLTKPTKEMMTYIRNNTEKNAVFSGWNWSMPWYVDLDNTGDHLLKNRATYAPEQRETVPEYFIVTPEWPLVKRTDEYPASAAPDNKGHEERNEIRKKFLKENATLVKTFGGDKHKWLLYRVNNDNLAHSLEK